MSTQVHSNKALVRRFIRALARRRQLGMARQLGAMPGN